MYKCVFGFFQSSIRSALAISLVILQLLARGYQLHTRKSLRMRHNRSLAAQSEQSIEVLPYFSWHPHQVYRVLQPLPAVLLQVPHRCDWGVGIATDIPRWKGLDCTVSISDVRRPPTLGLCKWNSLSFSHQNPTTPHEAGHKLGVGVLLLFRNYGIIASFV
ncbi:hypothetical protein V8C42DRAFT_194022 [Trichoderma barbatum]